MKRYNNIRIESIGYFITKGVLTLSLSTFSYLMFVKPQEIKFGGKNCEISQLEVGGLIDFDYDGNSAVREIKNVTLKSDGIQQVDDEGNLIKW